MEWVKISDRLGLSSCRGEVLSVILSTQKTSATRNKASLGGVKSALDSFRPATADLISSWT